jgi:hypothetical protein
MASPGHAAAAAAMYCKDPSCGWCPRALRIPADACWLAARSAM